MRHFDHLPKSVRDVPSTGQPERFDRDSERSVLAHALGATLYVPATRDDLAGSCAGGGRGREVDGHRPRGRDHRPVGRCGPGRHRPPRCCRLKADPPESLLFVRVRTVDQIRELALATGRAIGVVSGFVLPKFSLGHGEEYLQAVWRCTDRSAHPVYAMPVLETRDVLYRETREVELVGIRELLDEYRSQVLTVRIGATDLCGLFGIRRDRDLSIYDVGVAADLITQVVNHLGRTDGTGLRHHRAGVGVLRQPRANPAAAAAPDAVRRAARRRAAARV